MDLELGNKVAIITGGAKGIGAAIARSFAFEGAIPCILDRNRGESEALVSELRARGQRGYAYACEMTDERAVGQAAAEILAQHGRIDAVINNAGVNDGAGLRADVSNFRASLEKNLVHCFVLVQACLDALVVSRGCIVNIGTKCATTGQGGTSGYVAAKGGLQSLTREWAVDLASHGIRANCVIPAEVLTPMYERWLSNRPDPATARRSIERLVPLGHRMTSAEEIADMTVFLCSARSGHTTGQIIYVDGGYTHLDRACTTAPGA